MSKNEDLRLLAKKCVEISDELADKDGFVPVRKLVEKFDADIIFRPLLVEAMLASAEFGADQNESSTKEHKWAVFLDSETFYGVTADDIKMESPNAILAHRMRNTVAHELVHSLAFRAEEFGVKLTKRGDSETSWHEFVKWVEHETESLSPNLLIPDIYLNSQFPNAKKSIVIQDLVTIQQLMGVSRHVLVNRLNLLWLTDKFNLLKRSSLCNVAIGIGEWLNSKEANFQEWPLFTNFDRNIIPNFLINLRSGKFGMLANNLFNDSNFCFCGGSEFVTEAIIRGGTTQHPNAEQMKIICAIEDRPRKKGSLFLFVVQSVKT